MGSSMNILVQSSDYYASFAGVMLTSLFENNKDIDKITVYLVTGDMSEKSRKRFQILEGEYKRTIKFVDAIKIDSFLSDHQFPKWRNSYAVYYKIFALEMIEDELDRLIYLDADMVITGSMSYLINVDLGNNVLGMCLDAIDQRYKKLIRCKSQHYYNSGMIVFDMKKWFLVRGTDQIINYIKNVHRSYPLTDQDILNIVFQNQIQMFPLRFNLCSAVYVYQDYHFYIASNGIEDYYSECEFQLAKESPVVLHCMNTFGARPWYEGKHEAKETWNRFLQISPWNDYTYEKGKVSFVNRIQRILFQYTPKWLFAIIHRTATYIFWKRKAKESGLL